MIFHCRNLKSNALISEWFSCHVSRFSEYQVIDVMWIFRRGKWWRKKKHKTYREHSLFSTIMMQYQGKSWANIDQKSFLFTYHKTFDSIHIQTSQVMESQSMIYIVSEFASQGEIFGELQMSFHRKFLFYWFSFDCRHRLYREVWQTERESSATKVLADFVGSWILSP